MGREIAWSKTTTAALEERLPAADLRSASLEAEGEEGKRQKERQA